MPEPEREKLERDILGEACGVDCQINYGQNLDRTEREVDGWVLPVVEIQRITDTRQSLVSEPQDFYEGGESGPSLTVSDLW